MLAVATDGFMYGPAVTVSVTDTCAGGGLPGIPVGSRKFTCTTPARTRRRACIEHRDVIAIDIDAATVVVLRSHRYLAVCRRREK